MKKVILILLSTLFMTTPYFAADLTSNQYRSTLKDLRDGFNVYVIVNDVAVRHGLNHDQIQADVELKLRMAGIEILSNQEIDPEYPKLIVDISASGPSEHSAIAYTIDISVMQPATLTGHTPPISTLATTWSVGLFGTVDYRRLVDIRDSVKEQLDYFINAYLTENPM